MMKAAEARRTSPGKVYNAGNGNRFTLNEVWQTLQKIEGVEIRGDLRPARGRCARFAGRHHRRRAAISATIRSTPWSRDCAALWSGTADRTPRKVCPARKANRNCCPERSLRMADGAYLIDLLVGESALNTAG